MQTLVFVLNILGCAASEKIHSLLSEWQAGRRDVAHRTLEELPLHAMDLTVKPVNETTAEVQKLATLLLSGGPSVPRNQVVRLRREAPLRAPAFHERTGFRPPIMRIGERLRKHRAEQAGTQRDVKAVRAGVINMDTDLKTDKEYDVIVIGSGIGGLSAAALASRYGKRVLVCEAHTVAGGAAHPFERSGYSFDSGPSLWSGLAQPSYNPLRQVFDAIGESPEWKQYDSWVMYTEDGDFLARVGDPEAWRTTIAEMGEGSATIEQWDRLIDFIEPLQRAVLAIPPLALRADPGALLTALPYLGAMADPRIGLRAYLLEGPWSNLLHAAGITDKFLWKWFDFLAFAFSGLPSNGTVAAAMVYMLAELQKPGAKMDYPIGGSGAVVDALVRGLERHGGEMRLRATVSELLIEEGKCVGVKLKNGEIIRAREAVISNAPIWQTSALLPLSVRESVQDKLRDTSGSAARPLDAKTPATPSFVHLHLGIRADGLDEKTLQSIHHISVPKWDLLTAPQSTAFVSIPSLMDPSLAPSGRHVIHAYLPATEPYEIWEGLDRRGDEYAKLKQDRVMPLYRAIEKFIPDVRERTEIELVGSPLTHERYLRRFKGSYGPELPAGQSNFPGAKTPIDNLFVCGDSTWPGIGVPAVAGSGIAAVHAFVGVGAHKDLLDDMREKGLL